MRLLSGGALKKTAAVTMLTDHIGAVLIFTFIWNGFGTSPIDASYAYAGALNVLYEVCRDIGRLSFPIFCFLISEGASHTRDGRRYLLRLSAAAVISEIPFDLAVRNQLFYFGHQNVFFTLALGLAAVLVLRRSAGCEWKGIAALAAAMAAAELINADYGAVGVAVIFVFYYFRDRTVLASVLSYILLLLTGKRQVWSIFAFVLINLYNGRRGRQNGCFYYVFYPAHLLALWFAGNYLLPFFVS